MKDFMKKTIQIGDSVAFYAPGYRMFCLGKVIAFTPKKVRVEYNNHWNYPGRQPRKEDYLAEPNMFIVVEADANVQDG